MYHSRNLNRKADALTHHNQEVELQDGVKTEYCTKAFLTQDQVDLKVLRDLDIDTEVEVAPINEDLLEEPIRLIDRILQAN